jgi:hypothetical protein
MFWHLVEVLFFEDEADLVPCLLAWLQEHFHDSTAAAMAGGSHASVALLLAQGQVRGKRGGGGGSASP